jgi:hypothetical protein
VTTPLAATWKREVRVALSRKAQPVWFRVLKWIVIVAAVVALWGSPHFWLWIFGALAVGLLLHLFWRRQTHGWTRPWGGWNDVETANPEEDRPSAPSNDSAP